MKEALPARLDLAREGERREGGKDRIRVRVWGLKKVGVWARTRAMEERMRERKENKRGFSGFIEAVK